MGHILSKQGITPVNSKLEAIRFVPRPKDVSQLRSFLGMLNYYSKFSKDFSSKLRPLHPLLSKGNVGLFSCLDMILTLYSETLLAKQMQISSVDFSYNLRLMMIWIQMNTMCLQPRQMNYLSLQQR